MGFEPNQPPSKVEAINEFADHMKSVPEEAHTTLAKSKDDMARYYNQCQTPAPKFRVGDKVFLDATDITMTQPTKSFTHCYLGLYPIVCPVGSHAYCLNLCDPPHKQVLMRLEQVMWLLGHHQLAVPISHPLSSFLYVWEQVLIDVLHWRQESCMSDVALRGWLAGAYLMGVPLCMSPSSLLGWGSHHQ
jgi:hypothetical protein